MKVLIETMSDWSECEQCGGNSEDGGRVTIDGKVVFEHIPTASCYGNVSVSSEELLIETLKALGGEVNIIYQNLTNYEDCDYEGDG